MWTALVCLLLGGAGMSIYLSITSLATKPFSKFPFSHTYTREINFLLCIESEIIRLGIQGTSEDSYLESYESTSQKYLALNGNFLFFSI